MKQWAQGWANNVCGLFGCQVSISYHQVCGWNIQYLVTLADVLSYKYSQKYGDSVHGSQEQMWQNSNIGEQH
jgi:hypothetical protein